MPQKWLKHGLFRPSFHFSRISRTTVSTWLETSELLAFYLVDLREHVQGLLGLWELINGYQLNTNPYKAKYFAFLPNIFLPNNTHTEVTTKVISALIGYTAIVL